MPVPILPDVKGLTPDQIRDPGLATHGLTPGQIYQQTHPGPEPTPSVWNEFWGQITGNPLQAPYEMATGQMGGHPAYRDLLVYGAAALLVLMAVMGMLR